MKDSTTNAPRSFSRVGWGLFAMSGITSVLQLLIMAGIGALVQNGFDTNQADWIVWLATFLPLYAVGVPVGVWVMSKAPAQQKTGEKFGGKNFFSFLLMCFPLMYAGNLIGTILSMLLSGGGANNAILGYLFNDSPLKILVIVILAPLLEEFVFRKQIIDRLGRYGEKTAILFSAVSFALFHMNLFQFFYAFALGLVFAYVYTRTHRLRYPVIMHMIINFMGAVLAPLVMSLVDMDTLMQMAAGMADESMVLSVLPGLLGMLLYILAILGLSVVGLVLLCIKVRQLVWLPAEEELPKEHRFKTVYGNAGMILFAVLCAVVCVSSLL